MFNTSRLLTTRVWITRRCVKNTSIAQCCVIFDIIKIYLHRETNSKVESVFTHWCLSSLNTQKKRESPPAWTQDPYRPPCSKSFGGVPTLARGILHLAQAVPTLAQGYLPWHGGIYLGWGYPSWLWDTPPWPGGTYLGSGVPTLAWGYLPWPGGTTLAGVPILGRGIPNLANGYLPWPGGNLPWLEVPTLAGMGYPPGCEQTDPCKNSTLPHPSDAGGNNWATYPVQRRVRSGYPQVANPTLHILSYLRLQ